MAFIGFVNNIVLIINLIKHKYGKTINYNFR